MIVCPSSFFFKIPPSVTRYTRHASQNTNRPLRAWFSRILYSEQRSRRYRRYRRGSRTATGRSRSLRRLSRHPQQQRSSSRRTQYESLSYANEDWHGMVRVSLDCATFLARAAGNIFKSQGTDAGGMVFTASVSALLINVP